MVVELKRNREKKINIWLVWEVDRTNGEANIRAIDTSPDIAQKHLDGLVKCNEELSHRQVRFYIEPTMTDHLFGWKNIRCNIGKSR